jgi:RNA polymerase sigma-70 factor (ECF subfamily)
LDWRRDFPSARFEEIRPVTATKGDGGPNLIVGGACDVAQQLSIDARESVWATPDLRDVYEQHASYIYGLLARLLGPSGDAEDVMQDVFVVALKKLDLSRGTDVRSWLSSVAVRLAVAARRRVWFSRVLSLTKATDPVEWRTPDRALEIDEASRRVYAALEHLSEKKRTVFALYELQGMTGAEIAATLGCPEKTVWSRLMHARREFRRALQQEEELSRGVR